MADKKVATKKTPAKKRTAKKAKEKYEKSVSPVQPVNENEDVAVGSNGGSELRLTQLEQVELNLCDRDHELSVSNLELASAKLRNLEMDFQVKKSKLVDMIKVAKQKTEQLALIRNRKLSEIESRLRGIEPNFSFRDYLEQDDGLLVLAEDKIVALDPTATGGSDDTVVT